MSANQYDPVSGGMIFDPNAPEGGWKEEDDFTPPKASAPPPPIIGFDPAKAPPSGAGSAIANAAAGGAPSTSPTQGVHDPLAFTQPPASANAAPSTANPQPPSYTPPPDTSGMNGYQAAAAMQAWNDLPQNNPTSQMSEQQKAQYIAAQGGTGLAYGASGTGVTGDPYNGGQVATYDPAQVASNDALLAQQGRDSGIVQQVQGQQAANLANENQAIHGQTYQQDLAQYTQQANAMKAAGVTGTDQWLQQQMTNSGFDAQGNFIGAPANNPTAVPGGPETNPLYDPTKPVQPNNGSVDPSGNYVVPGGTADRSGLNPNGPPSDVPGGQLPPGTPPTVPPSGPSGPGTGGSPGTPDPGTNGLAPQTTPVNPDADLRSLQITPGALLDRFNLAQQQYGTYASGTDPQYQAALRDATRAAAGAGRLGSGMLRTSYGDLGNQRAQSLQNERDSLFQNALLGSVNDAQTQFQDLMQEQQYQTGAQNTAFNQNVTAQQLQEQLTNGSFNRALEQLMQGNTQNPSDTQLALSSIFGNQSSAAGQAMAQLFMGLANGSQGAQQSSQLQQLIDLWKAGSNVFGGGTPSGGGSAPSGATGTSGTPTGTGQTNGGQVQV